MKMFWVFVAGLISTQGQEFQTDGTRQFLEDPTSGMWVKQHVGAVKFAEFVDEDAVYVGTELGIVAALDYNTGEIIWRQGLHKQDAIQQLSRHSRYIVAQSNDYITRVFDIVSGQLLWESSNFDSRYQATNNGNFVLVDSLKRKSKKAAVVSLNGRTNIVEARLLRSGDIQWTWEPPSDGVGPKAVIKDNESDHIHIVAFDEGSTLAEITTLKLSSGQVKGSEQVEIGAPVSINSFAIASDDVINAILFRDGKRLGTLLLGEDTTEVKWVDANLCSGSFSYLGGGLVKAADTGGGGCTSIVDLNGNATADTSCPMEFISRDPMEKVPVTACFQAPPSSEDAVLLMGQDGSLSLFDSNGSLQWRRLEALAHPSDIKMFELPPQFYEDDERTLSEFPTIGRRLLVELQIVQRKLTHTANWVQSLIARQRGAESPPDHFGFSKAAVFYSTTGTVYALRTDTGAILWETFLPATGKHCPEPSSCTGSGEVLVMRQADVHSPTKPGLVGVFSEGSAGKPSYFSTLELHSGRVVSTEVYEDPVVSIVSLPFKNSPFLLISGTGDELSGTLLGEATDGLRKELQTAAPNIFFHTTDESTKQARGFQLTNTGPTGTYGLNKVWQKNFGSRETIVAVANREDAQAVANTAKSKWENGSHHVITKYLNPHLVAIATLAAPSNSRGVNAGTEMDEHLNIYLIDTVTGATLNHQVHRHAQQPIALLQIENRVIYSYWNAKTMESQISVISLWESSSDADRTTFSSFTNSPPNVIQKAWNLIEPIQFLASSKTRYGIANKIVIAGLNSGLARIEPMMLDPRRPYRSDGKPVEDDSKNRVMPYHRLIPFQPTQRLTGHKWVGGSRGVIAASTQVESTTVMLSYGIDLLSRRVTPSNRFDQMNLDFNYPMLALITIAIAAGVQITGGWLSEKTLSMAWK